jgi:hypothetical protein
MTAVAASKVEQNPNTDPARDHEDLSRAQSRVSDFCRRNDSRWVQVHFIPIHSNRSWKSSSRNEYHHTPHALLGVASLRFVVVRDFSWGRKSKVPESGGSRAAICVFVSVAAQAWSLRLRFRVLHLASRAFCWNQLLLASNVRLAFVFEST